MENNDVVSFSYIGGHASIYFIHIKEVGAQHVAGIDLLTGEFKKFLMNKIKFPNLLCAGVKQCSIKTISEIASFLGISIDFLTKIPTTVITEQLCLDKNKKAIYGNNIHKWFLFDLNDSCSVEVRNKWSDWITIRAEDSKVTFHKSGKLLSYEELVTWIKTIPSL